MQKIEVVRSSNLSDPPPVADIGFGQYFTDHMFVAHYKAEKGWHSPRVTPLENFSLHPAAAVLHYAQALFEGMKAYRTIDGGISLFRPTFHADRFATGARRLCMPEVPTDLFIGGIEELIRQDQRWVIAGEGTSLYLRPTLIGTESFLGMRPAREYLFFVIASPAAQYFKNNKQPLRIWIEKEQSRAAVGGLGAVKAAANYCASLQATTRAKEKGFHQVLWLDSAHRTNIEEVGTMNVFFQIGDQVITPPLDGTILGGATRQSVIELLKSWNIDIQERKITLQELLTSYQSGQLLESFGTGTAASVCSIGEFSFDGGRIDLADLCEDSLSHRLFDEISQRTQGIRPDSLNWLSPLNLG